MTTCPLTSTELDDLLAILHHRCPDAPQWRLDSLTTGDQGVIIPKSNVQHLMLREDVVQAVKEGNFSVHAVATIDEALELLTGVPAGEKQPDGHYPPGSINGRVMARLTEMGERLRELDEAARLDHDAALERRIRESVEAERP